MNTLSDNDVNALNEKRYQMLFENMLNGFAYCKMLYDEQGNPDDFIYLEVNRAFEEQSGLKDVIGKPVTQVIPDIKKENPELFAIYGRVAKFGKPEKFELFLKPLSIYFSISVYSPQTNYFVAVFDNITERKKTEKNLIQNEERLRLALKASKIGVWDWNMVTNVIHWSPEVLSLLGRESFGENIDELSNVIHPEDKDKVLESISQSVKKGEDYENEFRIIRPDGKEIWLSVFGITHYDSNKKPSRMVVATRDITERKKSEEILKAKTQELEKFFKLTVGRELQMVELKNKIKELEENK